MPQQQQQVAAPQVATQQFAAPQMVQQQQPVQMVQQQQYAAPQQQFAAPQMVQQQAVAASAQFEEEWVQPPPKIEYRQVQKSRPKTVIKDEVPQLSVVHYMAPCFVLLALRCSL